MNSLELKVPPPAVALLIGLLMWGTSLLVMPLEWTYGNRVAVVLTCAGLVLGLAAIISFRRAKTTINPTTPTATSSLVTSGVFRYTRNPMYLSLLLYLLAWAAYLSNWLALLVVPVYVLYINAFQIRPEERVLSSLFGADYAAYQVRVRRWL